MRNKTISLILIFLFLFSFGFSFATDETPSFDVANEAIETNSSYDGKDHLDIMAEACSLYDVNSGKFLYGKNDSRVMYPASTTKVLTAIVVFDKCKDLSEKVNVSYYAINKVPDTYSIANLKPGENFTINELLFSLLIGSANDSAFALAQYVANEGNNYPVDDSKEAETAFDESIARFSDMMNEKAKEIGCTNTHFVNPNGIHNKEHYSTARDLALIGNYAYKNVNIMTIARTKTCSLPNSKAYTGSERTFNNTNSMINPKKSGYYEYANGLKTGYTDAAMSCIIASAKKDDRNLIAVVLHYDISDNSSSREEDCKKLFEYGFNKYENVTLIDTATLAKTFNIVNATEETKMLDSYPARDLSCLVKTGVVLDVTPDIVLTKIFAPISEGDVIGYIEYKIDGDIFRTDLIASHDVKARNHIIVLWFILVIIIIFFILFVRNTRNYSNRNNRRNRRSRYHKNTRNKFYQNKYLNY